eukprot:TRINITY_DN67852_c5_g3_i1.p1 TRINITY_DN67852_c5_g3~~TRINITY_DN67852_c5_g3_i1.p1  ORF type:complete len:183 (+),score=18.28 TRINITY_DN67852_c5_g3_i1:63-551(+)
MRVTGHWPMPTKLEQLGVSTDLIADWELERARCFKKFRNWQWVVVMLLVPIVLLAFFVHTILIAPHFCSTNTPQAANCDMYAATLGILVSAITALVSVNKLKLRLVDELWVALTHVNEGLQAHQLHAVYMHRCPPAQWPKLVFLPIPTQVKDWNPVGPANVV